MNQLDTKTAAKLEAGDLKMFVPHLRNLVAQAVEFGAETVDAKLGFVDEDQRCDGFIPELILRVKKP